MGNYIFTMPAGTPPLTYAMLQGVHKIGTTVTIEHGLVWQHVHSGDVRGVTFRLYGTELAHIFPGKVKFPEHGDQHKATTEWLGKIVTDNGIGAGCYRENFVIRVSEGANHGKPVEGATFETEPSCGHCGALLIRIKGGWLAPRPFYRDGRFSSYVAERTIPVSGLRDATVEEQMTCRPNPGGSFHEPWCNHDAPAVRNGVCECGTRVHS